MHSVIYYTNFIKAFFTHITGISFTTARKVWACCIDFHKTHKCWRTFCAHLSHEASFKSGEMWKGGQKFNNDPNWIMAFTELTFTKLYKFYPNRTKNAEHKGQNSSYAEVKYRFHCTDFHKTYKCAREVPEYLLYRISPPAVKKYRKYEYAFIYALMYSTTVLTNYFRETRAWSATSVKKNPIPNFMKIR